MSSRLIVEVTPLDLPVSWPPSLICLENLRRTRYRIGGELSVQKGEIVSTGGDMDIACACGHHFRAWLWQSANITTNPELRKCILDGEMNVVKCPSCGTRFHVEVPFLYHDMSGKKWIWVYPATYEQEGGTINAKVGEMWDELTRSMPSDIRESLESEYSVFVIFGMDALVRYLKSEHDDVDNGASN